MEKNYKNDRREFIKKAGAVFGIGVFGTSFATIINSCERDEVVKYEPDTVDVDISQYPQLANIGGMAKVDVELDNGQIKTIVIRRDSETEFTVLDALCRHQNCIVNLPDSPDGKILCPCHQVTFNFDTGKVIDNKGFEVPPLVVITVSEFKDNMLKLII